MCFLCSMKVLCDNARVVIEEIWGVGEAFEGVSEK